MGKQFEKLADSLVETGRCKAEDREIIVYGLTTATELGASILTTVALGFAFGLVVESLVFLASFSFLRSYAGGAHAENAITCYFISSFTVIAILAMTKFTPRAYMVAISLVFILIAVPVILKLAPVQAPTKPLDDVEIKHYRKITVKNLILECVLIIVLLALSMHRIVLVISSGFILTALVIYIAHRSEQKKSR